MKKTTPPQTNIEQSFTPMTPEQIGQDLKVPVSQRGQPNLRDHVPARLVPLAEAKARGWSWFFTGCDACRYSHIAARRTSNPAICSDCQRVKVGEEPIYGKSRVQQFYDEPRRKSKQDASIAGAPVVIQAPAPPKAPELDAVDARFIEQYSRFAKHESPLAKAAETVGATVDQILARRVRFPALDAAMTRLEADLDIARYVPQSNTFEWTADKRALYVTTLIDTGSEEDARAAVGCSRSQFLIEKQANREFATEVEAAKQLAAGVIEDAVFKAAKGGQPQIVMKYLELLEKRQTASENSNASEAQLTEMLTNKVNEFCRQLKLWTPDGLKAIGEWESTKLLFAIVLLTSVQGKLSESMVVAGFNPDDFSDPDAVASFLADLLTTPSTSEDLA